MRVSVRSTGSPDYLVDIVADGLIRLLGRENVHLNFNRMATEDVTKSQLFIGFKEPNTFAYHESDVLVASTRVPVNEISDWINRTGRRNVAVLDGEDDGTLRAQFLSVARAYFKREYFTGATYAPTIHPLPFAAIPEPYEPAPARDIPVIFSSKYTSPIRKDIEGFLQGRWPGSVPGIKPKGEYNSILSRALVGVSARGAGWDTYRYWETAYFGCALVAQRMPIYVPGNFVEGSEAVFFGDAEEFKRRILEVLSNGARAKALGAAAREACLSRHLSTHRAKAVLDRIS